MEQHRMRQDASKAVIEPRPGTGKSEQAIAHETVKGSRMRQAASEAIELRPGTGKTEAIVRQAASKAVIELRQGCGKTQQAFAHEIVKGSIVTIGRWETSHPPTGDTLLKLAEIAAKHKRFDLEFRFKSLHLEEVHARFNDYTGFPDDEAWVFTHLKGQEERELGLKFLDALYALRKEGKK